MDKTAIVQISPRAAEIEPTKLDPAAAVRSYLDNLAPGSRKTMTQSLAAITDVLLDRAAARSYAINLARVEAFHWSELRAEHVMSIRSRLVDRVHAGSLAISTANKSIAALRSVLRAAWQIGRMTRDEYERAAAVERIDGKRIVRGRALATGEVLRLAFSCESEDTPIGARDGALVALLCFAGLRRGEVSSLSLEDWNSETGEITIQAGKGLKGRIVPVPEGVGVALDRWIKARQDIIRGGQAALFVSINRGFKMRAPSLTTDGIRKALIMRAKHAGVMKFSPHDGRRTYISELLDAGVDLSTAAALAGHADTNTTRLYDRRPHNKKAEAARRLIAPFTKTE